MSELLQTLESFKGDAVEAVKQSRGRRLWWVLLAGAMSLVVSGCSTAPTGARSAAASPEVSSWLPRTPAPGFLIPAGIFTKPLSDTGLAGGPLSATVPIVSGMSEPYAGPRTTEVLLYVSQSTERYLASGGLDGKFSSRLWESFLRKYKIPYRVLESVDQLETAQPGVLLMPSSVALSDREMQAIRSFRGKGGGVLATWLNGVRADNGAWRGFGFMEQVLDAKVLGNIEADENVSYLLPYGDNPVTHHLPAGQRVWLERAKEWFPLRLSGRQTAGQVMDWGRSFDPEKPSGAIVFDERIQPSGKWSRSVVLGYPERLWLSSDPKMLEAISHNAIMWLLWQPDAYVSAWPFPHGSALGLVIDSTDVVDDIDSNFAKMVEEVGGRATFYVLTDIVPKSAEVLKRIQARGHEIALLGDRYEGFKGQSAAVQAQRLDGMRKVATDAGLNVGPGAGFHAPLESYDRTTEALLSERNFSYMLTSNGATDTRLPFFMSTNSAKPMVVLPRTQMGPEDAMEEGDPEVGLQTFLSELTLTEKMAGLSLIRIPNQSLLTKEQLAEIFKHFGARKGKMWIATGRQLAEWWRVRDRVSAQLDIGGQSPQLTVRIAGDRPLEQPVSVWVNLPNSGSSLRLVPHNAQQKLPRIGGVDLWRQAVVLEGLPPGEYRWSVHFDRAAVVANR